MPKPAFYKDNEQDLLVAFHRGDSWALERVYQLFLPQLYGFTNALTADMQEAEDIAAECFVSAFHKTGDFSSLAKLKSFLFTSARNAALNFVDNRQRHAAIRHDITQSVTPFAEDPEKIYLLLEAAQVIYAEIEKLPPQCAEVVRRSVVEGQSAEEIALELHIAYKTVLNQRTKGLRLLRAAFIHHPFSTLGLLIAMLRLLPD